MLNKYSYTPFGQEIFELESVANAYEFSGQFGVSEEENGINYMRNRFYESNLGRFTSIDPIGWAGRDTNYYRYVNNNPVNFIDPDGLLLAQIASAFSFAVGVLNGADGNPEIDRRYGEVSRLSDAYSNYDNITSDDETKLRNYFWGQVDEGLESRSETPDRIGQIASLGLLGRKLADAGSSIAAGDPIGSNLAGYDIGQTYLQEPLNNFRDGLRNAQLGDHERQLTQIEIELFGLPSYSENASDSFDEAEVISSPLVLDLDGDGIELTALNEIPIRFDLDQDGFREATGWVQADDGLLVYDRNNDGFINDNSELFGTFTTSGFTELRELDLAANGGNEDGFIDAADSAFTELQVWRDLDQDGNSDPNELFTLEELGITRINANATDIPETSPDYLNAGNQVKETSFFEYADGTQGEIVDVWFTLDQLNSTYDHASTYNDGPVIFTEEILALPNLRGYGDLPDLHIAMAKDNVLLDLVNTFVTTFAQSPEAILAQLDAILFRWAGVDNINPSSRGQYIDARRLEFLEEFVGREYRNGVSSPGPAASIALDETYSNLQLDLQARLVAQLLDIPVTYDEISDRLSFNGSDADLIAYLELGPAALDTLSQNHAMIGLSVLDRVFSNRFSEEGALVIDSSSTTLVGSTASEAIYGFFGDDFLIGNGGDDSLNGGSGNDTLDAGRDHDVLDGGDGNDRLLGNNGHDTLTGGAGDDWLNGGYHNDSYLFNLGDGNDTIFDARTGTSGNVYNSSGGSDRLEFGEGINLSELNWSYDGRDLTLSITGSSDTVTIERFNNANHRIETFVSGSESIGLTQLLSGRTGGATNQDDTISWTASAIWYDGGAGDDNLSVGNHLNNRLYGNVGHDALNGGNAADRLDGGAGNDRLLGNNGHDTLAGGAGDDWLNGGYNNDTYLFNLGDGNDTIFDARTDASGNAYNSSGGSDRLEFGEGIDLSDLHWSYDGRDLTISITGSSDTVTIERFNNSNHRIETFVAGNESIGLTQLLGGRAGDATDQDDTISWTASAIWYDGGAGDDNLSVGNHLNNRLYGNVGHDALNGGNAADRLDGGTGNDTLLGNHGHDTLTGGTGDDWLNGGYHNDTYLFNLGDGNDTIFDARTGTSGNVYNSSGGSDRLEFGEGIDLSELNWSYDGRDLTLSITGSNDTVTIEQFNNSNHRIETFVAGGESIGFAQLLSGRIGSATDQDDTVSWTASAIWHDGGAGDDNLSVGNYSNNRLYGNVGNDTLNGGNSADRLDGGTGNDTLLGNHGHDTLTGGTGDDWLNGGYHNDTYLFNLGDGHDTIFDARTDASGNVYNSSGGSDRLELGEGITLQNLDFSYEDADLILSVSGTGDSVTIQNFGNANHRIETFVIAEQTLSHTNFLTLLSGS